MERVVNKTIDKIDIACKNYKDLKNSGISKYMKIDNWLYKESNIFKTEIKEIKKRYPKFRRGEIIKVDFGINIGCELSNTHFAIVLNADDNFYTDNITILPITSKKGYKRISLGKLLEKAIPNTDKYNLQCYGHKK